MPIRELSRYIAVRNVSKLYHLQTAKFLDLGDGKYAEFYELASGRFSTPKLYLSIRNELGLTGTGTTRVDGASINDGGYVTELIGLHKTETGLVAIWPGTPARPQDIKLQHFDTHGNAISQPTKVPDSGEGASSYISKMLPNGKLCLSWIAEKRDADFRTYFEISVQFVEATTGELGDRFTVFSSAVTPSQPENISEVSNLSTQLLSDGRIAFRWLTNAIVSNANKQSLYSTTFNPDTASFNTPSKVITLPWSEWHVEELNNGSIRYVSKWSQYSGPTPLSREVMFNEDGEVSIRKLIGTGKQSSYIVLELGDGNTLKRYTAEGTKNEGKFFVADDLGTRISDYFELSSVSVANGNALSDPFKSNFSFVSLADGRLLATWLQHSYDEIRDYIIKGRFFDHIGNALTDDFTIVKIDINSLRDSGALVQELSNGSLVVKYETFNQVDRTADLNVITLDPKSFKGTKDDETWLGGDYDEAIAGGAGDDYIGGGKGKDKLSGGDGDDTISGGHGRDLIAGGAGIDVALYTEASRIVYDFMKPGNMMGEMLRDKLSSIEGIGGSATGNDVLSGDNGANILLGNGGDDRLAGRSGNDTLSGGAGADTLSGGAGIDTLTFDTSKAVRVDLNNIGTKSPKRNTGDAKGDFYISIENLIGSKTGDDELTGTKVANSIWGQGGDDFIRAMAGNDSVYGGTGDDFLHGGTGADVLDGGSGQDFVAYYYDSAVTASLDGSLNGTGAAKGDRYVSIADLGGSNTGGDTLAGNSSRNFIYGNGGNDTLYGRGGSDILDGGRGADTLDGGGQGEVDYAQYFYDGPVSVSLDGSLTATGTATGDQLISIEGLIGSSTGGDFLVGNSANNILYGEGGSDSLKGRSGFDVLYGGEGNDSMNGGTNDDLLEGGLGSDRLTGGSGLDQFFYSSAKDGGDRILDFVKGDKIMFTGSEFTDTVGFGIRSANFRSRADNKAQDYNDNFIFRDTDYSLWFDPDGNGAAKPVLICSFANDYVLRVSDIEMYDG